MTVELRNLAEAIDRLAKSHPGYDALASAIVQNCVSHLCAVARIRAQNEQIHRQDVELQRLRQLALPIQDPRNSDD
jgi:hypothetical protein